MQHRESIRVLFLRTDARYRFFNRRCALRSSCVPVQLNPSDRRSCQATIRGLGMDGDLGHHVQYFTPVLPAQEPSVSVSSPLLEERLTLKSQLKATREVGLVIDQCNVQCACYEQPLFLCWCMGKAPFLCTDTQDMISCIEARRACLRPKRTRKSEVLSNARK